MKRDMELLIAFFLGFMLVFTNVGSFIGAYRLGYNKAIDDVIAGSKAKLKEMDIDPKQFDGTLDDVGVHRFD
jgi:hypothetical protein